MTQILITKPGVLSQRDRAALRKSGVVCVEAEDPSEVRLIQAESTLSGDDITFAALKALSGSEMYSDNLRASLPNIMLSILESKRPEGEER